VIVLADAPRGGSVDGLRLVLGLEPAPALAVLYLTDAAGAGTRLHLRLVGTGHQVVLDTPDGRISETVTRLAGEQQPHGVLDDRIAGRGYRFHGEVTTSPRMTRDLVHLYAEQWQDTAHVLRAVFPGEVQAIAEIAVELRGSPRRVVWSTLHTYPAAGQVLRTKSTVTMFPPAAPD